MNFVLYVHDFSNVFWDGASPVQTAVDSAQREINELVSSYTMGRVTVDLAPENRTLAERIDELENMVSGHVDEWSDARDAASDLVANWEQGDIAGPVNELRQIFDLNMDGSFD